MVEGHNVWRHCTEQFICSIKWNRLYWGRHLQEFHFHELTVSLKFFKFQGLFLLGNWVQDLVIVYLIALQSDWLIVCCFMSHLRIFHSSKDIKVKKKIGLYLILMTFVQREVFYFPWTLVFPNLFAFYHTDGYVVLTVCIRLRVVISKEFENFFFKNLHFT